MQLFIGHIQGNKAILSEEDAIHFSKVLRGNIGDSILVTDGEGKMGKGLVSLVSKHRVEVELSTVNEEFEKRDYRLHLAIAPTKSMDRIEFFIEKAVETGIDEISFLKSFHSERKEINLNRISKIVQSAVKQSLKAYVPKLNEMSKFNDFIKKDFSENKLIAHCNNDFQRVEFHKIAQPKTNYLILIGPEGDFSKEEIKSAEENGFIGISLGSQRLRTETAGLHAVFGVNWVNQ